MNICIPPDSAFTEYSEHQLDKYLILGNALCGGGGKDVTDI